MGLAYDEKGEHRPMRRGVVTLTDTGCIEANPGA
jgi:hypothetical protein